jgi:hypothetical protein
MGVGQEWTKTPVQTMFEMIRLSLLWLPCFTGGFNLVQIFALIRRSK